MDLTPISPSTIFEANATLITGILILLTISSFSEKNQELMKKGGIQALRLIVISVAFFVTSMGFLFGLNNPTIAENAYAGSVIAMFMGLLYLMITMFNIIRVLSKSNA